MLSNTAIGCVMMIVTTAIHAGFMVLTLKVTRFHEHHHTRRSRLHRIYTMGATILLMFVAALVEMGAWAGTLLMLGAIDGVEPALYFSAVTFTTLGYGDIVLDPQWRLLSTFEAANGIIMFGWTTAVVVAVVQRVYSKELPDDEQSS